MEVPLTLKVLDLSEGPRRVVKAAGGKAGLQGGLQVPCWVGALPQALFASCIWLQLLRKPSDPSSRAGVLAGSLSI